MKELCTVAFQVPGLSGNRKGSIQYEGGNRVYWGLTPSRSSDLNGQGRPPLQRGEGLTVV